MLLEETARLRLRLRAKQRLRLTLLEAASDLILPPSGSNVNIQVRSIARHVTSQNKTLAGA